MFEKIVDFHNAKFSNLWKGFSCECFIEDDKRLITFRKDELEILVKGEEANDLLDFVLSYFYENENAKIEDGFSSWFIEHYAGSDDIKDSLSVDDIPLPVLYRTLLNDWKRQDKIIKKLKNENKKCKQKNETYSLKIYELRKQLERYENGETNGETMHDIIAGLNEAVRKRNKKIEELEQKLSQLI